MDERMKANETEVNRAASFSVGSCTNGTPRPTELNERVLKNVIFNFLTKKPRNFINISTAAFESVMCDVCRKTQNSIL